MPDDECDYLIIGGGACGMAFADTLLGNSEDSDLRVVMVDKHDSPGGQWHDSYEFVRLHQPSAMYGVESKKLEVATVGNGTSEHEHEDEHRAKRSELLRYYADVREDLETKHDFEFMGNTALDLAQLYGEAANPSKQDYVITHTTTGVSRTIRVRKRLVDARNLEPDLPVSTPPRFAFSADKVSVVPVNDIVGGNSSSSSNNNEPLLHGKKHFVVVGGGKTGMDAVFHLLTQKNVSPENLLWVVPNDAWITAREKIGNCIDLLYTSAKLHDEGNASSSSSSNSNNIGDQESEEKKETNSTTTSTETTTPTNTTTDTTAPSTGIGTDFFQRGFLEWERQGHVYRLDPSVVPTKFKDATLSRDELAVLQTAVPRMVRGSRIAAITDGGVLVLEDGAKFDLPFPVEDTLVVHCSAGAFHCSKSTVSPPPIFEGRRIVVRDIYGTPGYCFVGSMLGKLESLAGLSDDDRNAMARTPPPEKPQTPQQGKSGGDVVGAVTADHPFLQRAHNLKLWMDHPDLREWIFKNRLFHLAHRDPATVSDQLQYIFEILQKNGIAMR